MSQAALSLREGAHPVTSQKEHVSSPHAQSLENSEDLNQVADEDDSYIKMRNAYLDDDLAAETSSFK